MSRPPPDRADQAILPRDVIRAAEVHFDAAVNIFRDMLEAASEGGLVREAEVKREIRGLHAAMQTLLDIRVKTNEQRRALEDGADTDVAAVRDKIGSLLDRLRAARGTGEVP